MDELSFSFLSSACYSLVFSVVWNQEQFHMILLKKQEESPEILSFKTIYCNFPAHNCQNSACGQNTREYWVLFVVRQSHFFCLRKLPDFPVVFVQSWIWSPKGSAGGTKKCCCCSLSRGVVWSAPLFCASLRTEHCGSVSRCAGESAQSGWGCGLLCLILSLARWALQLHQLGAAYGDLNFMLLLP